MKKIFLCFVVLCIMFLAGCGGNDDDDDSDIINAIAGTWENYYYGTVTFNADKTGYDSYGDNFNWTYKNGTVTINWSSGETTSFKYSGGETVTVDGMTFTKIGESEIPADLIGIWLIVKTGGSIIILNSDGTGLFNGFLPGTYTYKDGIISMKTERGTFVLNYDGNYILHDKDECRKLAEPTTPPPGLIGTWELNGTAVKFNSDGTGFLDNGTGLPNGRTPITYEYRNGVIIIKESSQDYHVRYYNNEVLETYLTGGEEYTKIDG